MLLGRPPGGLIPPIPDQLAGPSGLEPEQSESKSLVLPLHHGPKKVAPLASVGSPLLRVGAVGNRATM
jgi:hypothetical protein